MEKAVEHRKHEMTPIYNKEEYAQTYDTAKNPYSLVMGDVPLRAIFVFVVFLDMQGHTHITVISKHEDSRSTIIPCPSGLLC